MKNVKIVVDSSTGWTKKEAKESGFFYLPLCINDIFENKSYLDDGESITKSQILEYLKDSRLITSQSSVGSIIEVMNSFSENNTVVFVVIPKKISNLYFTIKNLISNKNLKNFFVIDNSFVSAPLIYCLKYIKKYMENFESVEEIQYFFDYVNKKNSVFFAVNDIRYLKNGGRINWGVAKIISSLNIVPVLEMKNGEIVKKGVCKNINSFVQKYVISKIKRSDSVIFISSYNEDDSLVLNTKKRIKDKLPNIQIIFFSLPNTIMIHTGPKMIGFWIPRKIKIVDVF
ncbi:DegV family EDD domain-containing protein [symbiont of Argiope bruennichi]|uniref:DegV family protein n=1 Tax=symbiont of Argiope bruennichi TaxID=2810479 RepID=UPI003DA3AF5A